VSTTITLTDITATLGVVFGTSGLILGILNYLRDRPKVVVSLVWNMQIVAKASDPEAGRDCGVVTITNIGRRSVFISHVCLTFGKHHADTILLLLDSVQGRKLSEGDPPATFMITYEGMEKYSKGWKKTRARVSDSTGKIYWSKPDKKIQPSWVKQSH